MKLFLAIDVWRQIDENQAICYKCFQKLGKEAYYVQSADFYHLPEVDTFKKELEKQNIELFIEGDLDDEKRFFPTLEEAIEAHIKNFENFFDNFDKELLTQT